MATYDGKTATLSFSIAASTATVSGLTWLPLGMLRTKGMQSTYDTADSTADSTAGNGKTALPTRLGHTFSGDGVSYDDAAYNQRTLKNHFYNPSSTTGNRPEAWFKLEYDSGEVYTGYFLMTSWSDDSPEADVQTFSLEAVCQGLLTYDDGVA